ncbi:CRISPR-associated endonuclease Cas3'' [Streptomyces longispororuber]|uniref:CRISPR-associated endonuclease Cas3'' n=1 Tax=Streptomyces longispororuber TaxID=68230 RepID=UPI001E327AEB|nr:CRISPR-associated endonuclease Cas3'' [Streptomyces longispororuber]
MTGEDDGRRDGALERQVWSLLGKTAEYAGGTENLLLSHMLDTAAVAERVWDGFLARATRDMLDRTAGGTGKGRGLLMWLAALHDLGKATPAWQGKYPSAAKRVREAGLTWHEPTVKRYPWAHERAGGFLLRRFLTEEGWPAEQVEWVWPLVAGHHGFFPLASSLGPHRASLRQAEGREQWPLVQRELLRRVSLLLGLDPVARLVPVEVPTRALQLHLAGLVAMADQMASSPGLVGVDDPARVSLDGARKRAAGIWTALGLRRGWEGLAVPDVEVLERRYGEPLRPVQRLVAETARTMAAAGMLIVEAPMGEGKTRAGLLAAEILAARFGFDGVFVGMPRWSTADPMFREVRDWVEATEAGLGAHVALLHLWQNFAPEWTTLYHATEEERAAAIGDCGEEEPATQKEFSGGQSPSGFYFGSGRGLLCPFVVSSADELLYAAARSNWASMRMAGLLGKVVVLDEVHATDVHGLPFLLEALRWLGQARVPVVLLSATLASGQRRQVADAYLAGATGRTEYESEPMPEPRGCARVTAVCVPPAAGAAPVTSVQTCASFRPDRAYTVEVLPEDVSPPGAEAADAAVVGRLAAELADGGCALVVRETTARAQALYRSLREQFGPDGVVLLHERMTARDRALRTDFCSRALSPRDGGGRPHRLVVVATRVAEESFDVDVDLLVTDPAPTDLLLQRVGRLHRDPGRVRPARLRTPRVLVTGMATDDTPPSGTGATSAPPRFQHDCERRHGRRPLLVAAHLVLSAAEEPWVLPARIPDLVARAYDDSPDLPEAWSESAEAALREWRDVRDHRADQARRLLLSRRGTGEGGTLAGLHYVAAPVLRGGRGLSALVRGEQPAAEAVVVVQEGGAYRMLSGTPLGDDGAVPVELVDELLTHTIPLPAEYAPMEPVALRPLPAWRKKREKGKKETEEERKVEHGRLRDRDALVLDARHRVVLAGRRLRYDAELGLVDEGAADEPHGR